jgi:PhoH-like ATPase
MPLPPAPSHRASRLTPSAFDSAPSDDDAQTGLIQVETKVRAVLAEQAPAVEAKRGPRGRKTAASAPSPAPSVVVTTAPTPAAPRLNSPTRPKRRVGPSKLFVLDTNVLMHDPTSFCP